MEYQHIQVTRAGDFERVTMRRPERRNALSEAHLRELLHAFETLGKGLSRGAILAAEGPVFSAGHDFGDMADRDLPETERLLDVCAQVMRTIQSIGQPVVAQVQALATAAGCQLVAACDLAVAAESAQFQVPGGRGGLFCITPGVALARAVGRKHALEMLLTGDPIDARTAMAWGLVNRVVPDDQLEQETLALLGRATRGSRHAKALGKLSFYRQVDLERDAAYEYASRAMAEAAQTPDAKEGIRSFLEKRKPRFDE